MSVQRERKIGDDWIFNFRHLDDAGNPVVIDWNIAANLIDSKGVETPLEAQYCIVRDQTEEDTKGCFKVIVPKILTKDLAGPLPPDYNPLRSYKETTVKLRVMYIIEGYQETQLVLVIEAKRP